MIQHRAICKKCGWHTRAPFADLFHVSVTCCPECGNEKPRWGSYSENWEITKMKFTYKKVKWWNIIGHIIGGGDWEKIPE